VLITIICNLLGYEATPFFVWGMYSEKEIAPDAYEVQEIIINDSIRLDNTSGYTPSTRFYINSPLWYFIAIKNDDNIDPTINFLRSKLKHNYSFIKPYEHVLFNDSSRINAFMPWYKNYLEGIAGVKIDHLKIINIKVHYSDQKIIADSNFIIGEWKQ